MRRIRHKPFRYPGNLGKRPTIRELNAAASASAEYEQERTVTLLVDLLDHYGIPEDDNSSKWFSLALRLARQHVPSFQDAAHVGRPRKQKPFRNLAELFNQYASPPIRGKPGRPKKWTDEVLRMIVDDVQRTRDKERLNGRGCNAKQALEILLKRVPPRRRLSLRKSLSKRLSEAKKKFQK